MQHLFIALQIPLSSPPPKKKHFLIYYSSLLIHLHCIVAASMVTTRRNNGIVKPNRLFTPSPPKSKDRNRTKCQARKGPASTRKTGSKKAKATLGLSATDQDVYPSRDRSVPQAHVGSMTLDEEVQAVAKEAAKSVKGTDFAAIKGTAKGGKKSARFAFSKQISPSKTTSKAIGKRAWSKTARKAGGERSGQGGSRRSRAAAQTGGANTIRKGLKDQTEAPPPDELSEALAGATKSPQTAISRPEVPSTSQDQSGGQPGADKTKPKHNLKAAAAEASSSRSKKKEETRNQRKRKATKASNPQSAQEAAVADIADQGGPGVAVKDDNEPLTERDGNPLEIPKRKATARNAALKKTKSAKECKGRTAKSVETLSETVKVSTSPQLPRKPGRPRKKRLEDHTAGPHPEEKRQTVRKPRKRVRVQDPSYRRRASMSSHEDDHTIKEAALDPSMYHLHHHRRKPRNQDPIFRPSFSPQSYWSEPSPHSETHASVHPARNSRSLNRNLWKAPMDNGPLKAYTNDLRHPRQKGRVRDPVGARKKRTGSLEWIHERSPLAVNTPRKTVRKSRKRPMDLSLEKANRKIKSKLNPPSSHSSSRPSPLLLQPNTSPAEQHPAQTGPLTSHQPRQLKRKRSVTFVFSPPPLSSLERGDPENPHLQRRQIRRHSSTIFQNPSPSNKRKGSHEEWHVKTLARTATATAPAAATTTASTTTTHIPSISSLSGHKGMRASSSSSSPPSLSSAPSLVPNPPQGRLNPIPNPHERPEEENDGRDDDRNDDKTDNNKNYNHHSPRRKDQIQEKLKEQGLQVKESYLRSRATGEEEEDAVVVVDDESPSPGRIAAVVQGMIKRFSSNCNNSNKSNSGGGSCEGDGDGDSTTTTTITTKKKSKQEEKIPKVAVTTSENNEEEEEEEKKGEVEKDGQDDADDQ